jgi:nitronate monooxygenase
LSSQRLTASVSNYGGLGSFGALALKPEAIRNVIREIKGLTTKPFAMNLWVSMEDEGALTSTEEAFHRSLAPLAKHIESVEGPKPTYLPYEAIRFEDQVQVLLDEGISVFSFIYGIPSKQILDDFRRQGTVLIGTATTVDEAIALEQAGVDVIAASGFEAGGHRGSFLQPSEDSLIGTMALVPQVADAVRLPVVAAGGIGDARGVVAAFALGAEGVQMGTAFLACEDSGATALHRTALLSGQAKQTALTRGFTGRLARGIKNRLLDELNQKDIEILPYPLQRALVRNLSIPAAQAGRAELLPLWAGQSANLSRCADVRVLLDTLVKEISEIGGAVQSWSTHRQLENAHG